MAGKIIADIIEAPYDSIKMNVGNVTVLTANSSGLNYIPTGNVNVTIGGANANLTMNLLTANGIKFPATQVSSADPNTLDDYEEGSWTPAYSSDGTLPTVTYTSRTGTYVKIGRQVTLYGQIIVNTMSGGTGKLLVTGLPFTGSSNSDECGGSVGLSFNWNANPAQQIQQEGGATYLYVMRNFANVTCSPTDPGSGSYFFFNITYVV